MRAKGNIRADTLLLIPCCAKKSSGGKRLLRGYDDILIEFISRETYDEVISYRKEVLNELEKNPKYLTDKYFKNMKIVSGPDFGQNDTSGAYLPAIDRYSGSLYSVITNFSSFIKINTNRINKPKLIILSALYGPLHPFTLIQDYNLKMSDSPAYQNWKIGFPMFLNDYVQKNRIREIRLYLGKSSTYFKVVKGSLVQLSKHCSLRNIVHIDVMDGDSFNTPYNHGCQLISDLGYIDKIKPTRVIKFRQLSFLND